MYQYKSYDSPVSSVPLGLVRGDTDEVRKVASGLTFGYRHVLGDAAENSVQQLDGSLAVPTSRLIPRWYSGEAADRQDCSLNRVSISIAEFVNHEKVSSLGKR